MKQAERTNQKRSGLLGLSSVVLFAFSLVIFGNLNAEFDFMEDFVSKLGAKGEPNAIWWNLIGFGLVGVTLAGFGIYYGRFLGDKLAGLLLALFGVGFAFTSLPIDMTDSNTPISKAHILSICLALASWLFGLARIAYNHSIGKKTRYMANAAAILIVSSMVGFVVELWSMPLTHRLVFLVVFGWTAITSIMLLIGLRSRARA